MIAADLATLANDLQNIQTRVVALEQENARLVKSVGNLFEQLEAKDYFIQLMAPHMAPVEAKKDVVTADFAELLRAYEKARGEGD